MFHKIKHQFKMLHLNAAKEEIILHLTSYLLHTRDLSLLYNAQLFYSTSILIQILFLQKF